MSINSHLFFYIFFKYFYNIIYEYFVIFTYMDEIINQQFDNFQKELEIKQRNLKYQTHIEINDDFYKLIDNISGSELSDENNRRNKNTNNK